MTGQRRGVFQVIAGENRRPVVSLFDRIDPQRPPHRCQEIDQRKRLLKDRGEVQIVHSDIK